MGAAENDEKWMVDTDGEQVYMGVGVISGSAQSKRRIWGVSVKAFREMRAVAQPTQLFSLLETIFMEVTDLARRVPAATSYCFLASATLPFTINAPLSFPI